MGKPTDLTLRIRAMVEVERLRAKLADRAGAELSRRVRFENRQEELTSALRGAEADLDKMPKLATAAPVVEEE